MINSDLIAARRAFRLDGYCTLSDVDMDGDYVSPLQLAANSQFGPILLAYNWLDAESVPKYYPILRKYGYLPHILFNKVIDRALTKCGRTRADIYMTQVFHLLPLSGRSSPIPTKHLDCSFQAITLHEINGRKIVALGTAAAGTCRRNGVTPHRVVDHPSARGRGRTIEGKANELADALKIFI